MGFKAKQFLDTLTARPGVYCMIDNKDTPLYVGKAKNLKKRVSSYFVGQLEPRIAQFVKQIARIDVTVTPSEKDALLLENSLIKRLKPRYNVYLKDDKSYPYLFLSDHPQYPQLTYHRGPQTQKGHYFGPYPNSFAVRNILKLIQKLFKLRQCEDSFFKLRSRPCLQHQINRCSAPCVGLIDQQDYARQVSLAQLFLKGNEHAIMTTLVEQMQQASKEQAFEQAAHLRDQIKDIQSIRDPQSIITSKGDVDVVAVVELNGQFCVHMLFVRSGNVLGSQSYFPKVPKGLDIGAVQQAFIEQFYFSNQTRDLPKELVLGQPLTDSQAIEQCFKEIAHHNVQLTFKPRQIKAQWVHMAQESGQQALRSRQHAHGTQEKRFKALQAQLGLSAPIQRIECFDISHSQGESTTASCVVFEALGPLKREYRLYHIESVTNDDYGAMAEVLMRRYAKLKAQDASLPDIVLIDGGKGQLNQAIQVMSECQITECTLMAIAKGQGRKPGLETLFIHQPPKGIMEIHLPPFSEALHLIQHARDEAHRFAITQNRKRQRQKAKHSFLEEIEGIGPVKGQQLLNYFGGLHELNGASLHAIAKVPGISLKLAEKIYQALHQDD